MAPCWYAGRRAAISSATGATERLGQDLASYYPSERHGVAQKADRRKLMDRAPEPGNAGERDLLLGWLAFHRDALAAKCEGLTAEQLVEASAPPSDLSLLGLVRHMTEMEHAVPGATQWPAARSAGVYCTDEAPDADIVGLSRGHGCRRRWLAGMTSAPALTSYFRQTGGAGGNLAGKPVVGALEPDQGDPGVRQAQRPCRPDQGAHRRRDRRVNCLRRKTFDSLKQSGIWLSYSTVELHKTVGYAPVP